MFEVGAGAHALNKYYTLYIKLNTQTANIEFNKIVDRIHNWLKWGSQKVILEL